MTFVLKDYTSLETDFNSKVVSYLLENGIITTVPEIRESINSMDEKDKRKHQLNFLFTVLDYLRPVLEQTKIEKPIPQNEVFTLVKPHSKGIRKELKKAKTEENITENIQPDLLKANTAKINTKIFYGAMQLIRESILARKKLYESNGYLYELLTECIGDSLNPLNEQFIFDCYTELNRFFAIVMFNNSDSRQGLNLENPFKNLPQKTLIKLVDKSYELQQLSHNQLMRNAQPIQITTITSPVYEPQLNIPIPTSSVASRLKDWRSLCEALNLMVWKEHGKHRVVKTKDLNPERASQVGFLEKIQQSLDKSTIQTLTELNKVIILYGAMYIVRAQINSYYKDGLLSREDHLNSNVHTELNTILEGIDHSEQNIEYFVNAAHQYVHFLFMVPNQENTLDNVTELSAGGIRIDNEFADVPKLKIPDMLETAQAIIHSCRSEVLKNFIPSEQEKNPSKKDERSLVGVVANFATLGLFSKPKKTGGSLVTNDGSSLAKNNI